MAKNADLEPTTSTSIRPAGREIELWHDEHFSRLRKDEGVPDSFINEGWTYDDLVKGGGKGGTLMAFLWGKYIVKEMSQGDHQAMLDVTPSYINHLTERPSLITKVFMHYRDVESGRIFFAMRNDVGKGPFKALYDLKGCADDKIIEFNGKPREAIHKRCWQIGMWCGKCRWSHERHAYYNGKVDAAHLQMPMPEDQRLSVAAQVSYDVEWLASCHLMDYSLLVAMRSEAPDNGGTCFEMVDEKGNKVFLCLSIIDFLQRWTCGKRVARCLKFTECNKATVPPHVYGRRFERHFNEHCFKRAPDTIGQADIGERV